MSNRVASKENPSENFLSSKFFRKSRFKEIPHRAKLSSYSETTRCISKSFRVACMSKCVASKGEAQESFLLKEYVRIPRYKEIQCCRVKSNRYVLETLYEKK